MTLDYESVHLYGRNCGKVLGVKEHGASMTFELTDKACEELYNKFAGVSYGYGYKLNVYADGYINLTVSDYDYSTEEFTESEELEFCGKGREIIIIALDEMLDNNPLRVQDDRIKFIGSYAELVDFLSKK